LTARIGQKRDGGLASFSPAFEQIEHETEGQIWIVRNHLPGKGKPSDPAEQVDQQGGNEGILVDIGKQALALLGQFIRHSYGQGRHGESGRLGLPDRLRFQVERVGVEIDVLRPGDSAMIAARQQEECGLLQRLEAWVVKIGRQIETPDLAIGKGQH